MNCYIVLPLISYNYHLIKFFCVCMCNESLILNVFPQILQETKITFHSIEYSLKNLSKPCVQRLIDIGKCRYDLGQADLAVAGFNELSVINLRRLFANNGSTFMDMQKQIVEKSPPKRKLTIDTIF